MTVVARAETAASAAEACRSSMPELLVLDLELPDADGFRVLDDLADVRPRSVLVLANNADGDRVLQALRVGARGYVMKADGLRDLASTIRRVVAGERVMTPELEKDAIGALGRLARRARESADLEADLTQRQRQVLELLGDGRTMGQIASRLGISPRTVETHVTSLYRSSVCEPACRRSLAPPRSGWLNCSLTRADASVMTKTDLHTMSWWSSRSLSCGPVSSQRSMRALGSRWWLPRRAPRRRWGSSNVSGAPDSYPRVDGSRWRTGRILVDTNPAGAIPWACDPGDGGERRPERGLQDALHRCRRLRR